jgi:hypothetical protein
MNENQQEILLKTYLKLEENFDHIVIIVCEKEKSGSFVQPDPIVCWSGGLITAKHLVQDAISKIDRRKLTRSVPPIEKNIVEKVMKNRK